MTDKLINQNQGDEIIETLENIAEILPTAFALEEKVVSPSESQQTVEAGTGYYGLSRVTVSAVNSNYNELSNQPQINGTTLSGDQSAFDLDLAPEFTDSQYVENLTYSGQEGYFLFACNGDYYRISPSALITYALQGITNQISSLEARVTALEQGIGGSSVNASISNNNTLTINGSGVSVSNGTLSINSNSISVSNGVLTFPNSISGASVSNGILNVSGNVTNGTLSVIGGSVSNGTLTI